MSTFTPPAVGPQDDPRVGTVLRGKYRLDRVIGAGGMAVVYKATHRNHAEFAVKMLHPALSVREDIRSRFIREGYAANAVKHPGAVLVVDDDVADDGAAFLVMELLDGLSCDHLWASGSRTVSSELASAVAIQVLDVLAAAHEKGIVHRDIKPANVFLARSGVVKVLDFGIARTREAIVGVQVTTTGMTLGTPAFMAPEHARGRTREVDGRTDVWAVGATFFSMVSGQLVHEGETANEFLIAAGTKPARSLVAALPDAPPELVAVIDRALAFEKVDRWQSAAAMRDALREAHAQVFGNEDVRAAVASAVSDLAPPPPRPDPLVSPVAETRTFPPVSSTGPEPSAHASGERVAQQFGSVRTPTERLSTSAAMSRDREPMLPRTSRWALGAGSVAVAAGAFVVGTWMLSRRAAPAPGDGGTREKMVLAARDGTVTTSPVIELPSAPSAPPPPSAMPPPPPPPLDVHPAPSPAPSASSAPRVPFVPRRTSAIDAGSPAANCSPPWFFDPAGHKQYKPECL